MITAIEANILLNALVPNEKFYEASVMALESAATSGSLVVCDLVYAELCTYFSSQRECDAFLEGNEIRVEPSADNYRDRHEHFTGRSAAEREVLFSLLSG